MASKEILRVIGDIEELDLSKGELLLLKDEIDLLIDETDEEEEE